MDTRRLILALFAAMAVFYLWMMISQVIWPRKLPTSTQPAASQPSETSSDADDRGVTTSQPATQVGTRPGRASQSAPATMTSGVGNLVVKGGEDASPIVLGNAEDDSPYPMSIEIIPQGASVGHVKIRGHYDSVTNKVPYPILAPVSMGNNEHEGPFVYSFTTNEIRFEGRDENVSLGDIVWEVIEHNQEQVKLSVEIQTRSGDPLARIIKTYELHEQSPKPPTYDLGISVEIRNLASKPIEVKLIQQGAIGFRQELPRREDRRVVCARLVEGKVSTEGQDRGKVFKKGKALLGRDDDDGLIAWVAEANQYFACIMAPAERLGPDDKRRFDSVEAIHLTDRNNDQDKKHKRQDLTFKYITTPRNIPVDRSEQVKFDCYIGPKSKRAFEEVDSYNQRHYYIVISETFYFCAPNALVELMMKLLNAFHAIPPHNYGVAIIILVLAVRALLHPVTKKSQVNMMKMQQNMARIQPKIQAAKEKYANDKVAMNQAIMQTYRDEGINPAGNILTCLPMFLQIPIWAALWTALSSTIEMRHAPFDGWWIKDLAGPDALYTFSNPVTIPLVSFIMGGPLESLNLLPILLGISQVLQARFMPRGSPVKQQSSGNPDQLEQQRKMMMFMSILFVFFLYNAPAGLNLYIMSSNLFGILEQMRIRKHLTEAGKKLEQEEKEAKVKKSEPRKKTWLQKKWHELEKQVNEARRQPSHRKNAKVRK